MHVLNCISESVRKTVFGHLKLNAYMYMYAVEARPKYIIVATVHVSPDCHDSVFDLQATLLFTWLTTAVHV